MLIECMSINSLQLVIRGVIPAIKLYVSLYLHSKCILLNVVLKLSIVPFKMYTPQCCPETFYCYKHCNFSNCPICGEDTMPDVTKLKTD